MLKRIIFALRGGLEIFRATKTVGCDSPLVVMTAEDVQQQLNDMNRLIVEKNLLYQVVDHMVDGGSPCMWCRDYDECTHANKGGSTPCCGIWDLIDLVREEAAVDEPGAEAEAAEGNP